MAGEGSVNRFAATGVAALVTVAALAGCVSSGGDPLLGKADMHQAARINTQLGIGYLREGQLARAQDKLKRAIDQDPDYGEAHQGLALVYLQRGDRDSAEKEYRKALSLDRDNPELQNNFGVFLCEGGKADEGQRYLLQAAQNRDYGTPEAAFTNAGVCAARANQLQAAEADFREALRVSPDFPDALFQMARIAFRRQDWLRARAFIQRYERVGKPTPQSLLLASQVERQLGNASGARDRASKLIQMFPSSDEASQALKTLSP